MSMQERSALRLKCSDTSSLVKNPAPGDVYKNVNVWVVPSGFGSPKNIKEAVITFKVVRKKNMNAGIRTKAIGRYLSLESY